jgi:O-methyltransferase involved in polyketide biosynthesis
MPNHAPDHNKISFTAKLVAYYRQFSDIPFSRDVARYIGADEAFQSLISEDGLNPDELIDYAPILEARYKSIVSLILKSGISQVLELASGFSLRGLAMTRDPAMAYIETDLAELTSEKIRLVSEIRAQYHLENFGNHHIASANALDPEELRAAVRPLRRDKKLVIVNEGLIQYFSATERETLAKNVRNLLHEYGGGVWITPDFAIKTEAMNITEERRRLRHVIMGVTERSFYNATFDTNEQMNTFFGDFGFRATVHDQVSETPYFASVETLGLSRELMERAKFGLMVWVLSPV